MHLRLAEGANKCIRQCLHWLMHMPPACADMIRISPFFMKNKVPHLAVGDLVFMAEMERFARRGHRAGTHTGTETCPRHVSLAALVPFSNLSMLYEKQGPPPCGRRPCFYGGDGEIRTLEELLTPTRFPIVRARPTTRHLHVFAQGHFCSFVSLAIIIHTNSKVKEFLRIRRRDFAENRNAVFCERGPGP